MPEADCDIRIGTSGWHYQHWQGLFYPAGLPKTKWFSHYVQNFDTVEINNTFYQLPKAESIKRWRTQSPARFIYAVKANRYITHIKKLKDAAEPLERFLDRINILGQKLGPVLYQLPPTLHKDLDLLESFIKLLPEHPPAVFEFRHKNWFSQDCYDLLDKFHLGFCIHDMLGIVSPRVVTADIIYIRFHGPTGRYSGCYTKSTLQEWADWAEQHTGQARGIYVYFNNDAEAYAVRNAKTLRNQISRALKSRPLTKP